jgi:hypothetical protein
LFPGYLPLVWAGTLAYYLDNAFEEAGLVLPVAAATFGLDMPWLPTFVVDPVVTGRGGAAMFWWGAPFLRARESPTGVAAARQQGRSVACPRTSHLTPAMRLHPGAEFLQGSTLLFGAVLSLALTRKLGARPWAQLLPQCFMIVAFTAELYSLIIPN